MFAGDMGIWRQLAGQIGRFPDRRSGGALSYIIGTTSPSCSHQEGCPAGRLVEVPWDRRSDGVQPSRLWYQGEQMRNPPAYKSEIESRVRDCELQRRAFEIWLSALMPANLILVVGAGLLSLFAGASILTQSRVITTQTAGFMALASAALTLIHNLLRCDPHQAECRRLRRAYEELRIRYHSLDAFTDETEIRKQLVELDKERATIAGGANATPAVWSTARAARSIPQ